MFTGGEEGGGGVNRGVMRYLYPGSVWLPSVLGVLAGVPGVSFAGHLCSTSVLSASSSETYMPTAL